MGLLGIWVKPSKAPLVCSLMMEGWLSLILQEKGSSLRLAMVNLMLASNKENKQTNHHPIIYLHGFYHLFTSIISQNTYSPPPLPLVITDQQRGCIKKLCSCKELLTSGSFILSQAWKDSRIFPVAYTDYQKTFDYVHQSWLLEILSEDLQNW